MKTFSDQTTSICLSQALTESEEGCSLSESQKEGVQSDMEAGDGQMQV